VKYDGTKQAGSKENPPIEGWKAKPTRTCLGYAQNSA